MKGTPLDEAGGELTPQISEEHSGPEAWGRRVFRNLHGIFIVVISSACGIHSGVDGRGVLEAQAQG